MMKEEDVYSVVYSIIKGLKRNQHELLHWAPLFSSSLVSLPHSKGLT